MRPLDERLLEYSAGILRLCESLSKTVATKLIIDQLLRSGTAVGANYEEAKGAESKADFIHKLQVALKESRESCYWLKLILNAGLISNDIAMPMVQEALELRAILSKSVATAKSNQ